ncbi:hypothetical protein VA7868_00328 [Vibrio aerogenes CECT 7868]|uniref:SnoaL-like domain-containing protein n=1 Tax=Vibrio aerogenes CECT 7868 TaxID=1216006 RepID=A0A1M5VB10_9VIBR|nr:nuclear transport factor 2 family protein [Vibrio aerogenes]SHH72386.1 hypothetical protein VA7868_00328 [Vibrio aerogenes CECT 7868]
MSVPAHQHQKEHAQIISNINSFATFADQSAFAYLGRLFSEEVVVDYTSVFGGEPATVHRGALIRQWAGLQPGFDNTLHHLSGIDVELSGTHATVTADVTASHFIDDDGFWQISGQYQFEMEKTTSDWTIHALTLRASAEQGNREILYRAMEKAQQNLAAKESRKLIL